MIRRHKKLLLYLAVSLLIVLLTVVIVFVSPDATSVSRRLRAFSAPRSLVCGDDTGLAFYNYAPSAIYTGDNVFVYFCSNYSENYVVDHIYMSRIDYSNDTVTYTDKTLALSPTYGSWDGAHVCDPSVISGNFDYNGKAYGYLMAYLGCDRTDCQHNQVGIAVAESFYGDWVKVDEINPIVPFELDLTLDSSYFQWGTGQPSVVSVDGKGTVALFYTRGDGRKTCTMCEVWDLSHILSPVRISKFEVSNSGTHDCNGKPEILSNTEFAYDSSSGYIYMFTDKHPFSAEPDIIADSSDIYRTYISSMSNLHVLADAVWEPVDNIGYRKTGSGKNHNGGFLRTASGKLATNSALYTSCSDGLWSYRIGIADFNADIRTPDETVTVRTAAPVSSATVPAVTTTTESDVPVVPATVMTTIAAIADTEVIPEITSTISEAVISYVSSIVDSVQDSSSVESSEATTVFIEESVPADISETTAEIMTAPLVLSASTVATSRTVPESSTSTSTIHFLSIDGSSDTDEVANVNVTVILSVFVVLFIIIILFRLFCWFHC